jgi:predicted metal-dependent phosphoesterase TrpH
MPGMLRVEFHCHTYFSKDSLTRVEALLLACRRRGIDRVVITDHNSTGGAVLAQKIDPERVIVGEEIMTQQGELLAAFVREELPKGLPAREAIDRLRGQGAFISVSHPFDRQRSGAWSEQDLLEITPFVDAIEIYNSRCLSEKPNLLAQAFARAHHLLGTAGSDAHIPWEIGRGTLLVPPFHTAAELKQALSQAQIDGHLSGAWVHGASTAARLYKKLKRTF